MLELVTSPRQRKFGEDKRDTLTQQCRTCEVLPLCNGGCPKERFMPAKDGEPGQNYLCEGLYKFFKHTQPAMRRMAQLFQQGRAPAEIMTALTAEDARRDVYAPCPCGSGRKFRFCHGAREAPPIATTAAT
jgi:uncharacterized protein